MPHEPPTPNSDEEDSELNEVFDGVGKRITPSEAALARAKAQTNEVWLSVVAQRQERLNQQRKRHLRMALAATALLAIAAAMFLRLGTPSNLELELAAGRLEHRSPAGNSTMLSEGSHAVPNTASLVAMEPSRLHLPSGAELRLAQATKVSLVGEDRLKLVTGQIYIDTHNRADMTVITSAGEVADIGTQYSVSQDVTGIQVAVRSGSAVLTTSTGRYQADADETSAEIIEISESGEVQQHREPKSAPRWRWIQSTAAGYSSHEVSRVLEAIAADLGVQLRYASVGDQASLANVTYAGDLTNMTPKQALELVALSVDLHWTLDEQTLAVSLKQP